MHLGVGEVVGLDGHGGAHVHVQLQFAPTGQRLDFQLSRRGEAVGECLLF